MTGRWGPRSVRVRLTLWYVGTLAVVLGLYAGGVFAFVRHSLTGALDRELRDDFEIAEQLLDARGNRPLARRSALTPARRCERPVGGAGVRTDGSSTGVQDPTQAPSRPGPASKAVALVRRAGITAGSALLGPVSAAARGAPWSDRGIVAAHCAISRPAAPWFPRRSAVGPRGYGLARRRWRPSAMAERARTITADRLGERLPIEDPEAELGQLATVFNDTLARLERSFAELRRFTADASHELRTPLTAIRSVGEVGLRRRRDEQAYREIIGSMLEEADRLARLVDSLLLLSRADAGQVALRTERTDLGRMAQEVAAQLEVLAEEAPNRVHGGGRSGGGGWTVRIRALINLLDNAIKYSPEGAHIRVVFATTGGAATG